MNITQIIEKLYPELIFGKDYSVRDDGNGPYLIWYNKEIEEPTEKLLENTWNEVSVKNEIKEKLNRMKEIRSKLIELGYSTELPGDSRLFPKLEAQKKALLDEWEQIKKEVEENYESSLIDDVISSFFE